MSDYEYFGLAPGASTAWRAATDSARLYDEHVRRVRRTRARIHAETLKERVAEQFAQLNRAGIALDLSRYGFATANGVFK